MTVEFEKNMRILTDIVAYCHNNGALDYDIKMRTVDNKFISTITCTIIDMPAEMIDELTRELNRPRRKEIEQNYWGLTGDTNTDINLTLIGVMIDEAIIVYEAPLFSITVTRYGV